jgi:arginine decarboxylase
MKRNFKKFWKLGREEFNTQYFDITKNGELMLKEGNYQYNIASLIKKYGSPLEIIFPFIVENRLRNLIDIFNAYIKLNDYKGKFFYHYPMKVNQNKEFVLSLVSEGSNLETSSVNELWIVKKLWEQEKFNAKIRVLCNGPKTDKYISLIDELNRKGVIITPIIEHENEMQAFKQYKGEVGVRVNMNIKVKGHWDKKFTYFGFPEDELLKMKTIRNLGLLSYHISSQVERIDGLVAPVKHIMKVYAKLRERNPKLDTIDI